MLTLAQLVALHRSLAQKHVLSVYLNGTESNPATQRAWRVQLNHRLQSIRERLTDTSARERDQFEHNVRVLNDLTLKFDGGLGSPGWAAFIAGGEVCDAQLLPVSVPTLVEWNTGITMAPYVRVLKELRCVAIALADAKKVTLYRYCSGKLEHVDTELEHHTSHQALHMGNAPRQGFHSGTRGTTAHDEMQRTSLAGRDRMLAEAVPHINATAGADGWILLGGIRGVVARLADQLGSNAAHRILQLDSLDVHATEAEIATAARTGASALRAAFDLQRITTIEDNAGAHTLGVIGREDTFAALEQTCVHELYLTHKFLEEHLNDAENAVRLAMEQDASLEEVSGQAAEELDRCGGIAASLRFRPATIGNALETTVAVEG